MKPIQLGFSMATAAVKGGVSAGFVAIFVAGCTVSPPSAPSTNFFINIPVANDSTSIGEIVAGRSNFLQIDENTGGMALHVTVPENRDEVLGTAKVGENLATPATAQALPPTPIGTIELAGAELPGINLTLEEVLGEDVPAGSTIAAAVPTDVNITADPTEFELEGVQEVVIIRAGIELEITNRLPMPLSTLEITLRDRENDNRVVGEPLLIENVAALVGQGGTPGIASGRLSLDGETISGQLSIEVSFVTPDVGEVEVGDNPGLEIVTSLPPLEVQSATALIPQQVFAPDKPQIVQFPPESRVLVDTAAIAAGAIKITIDNKIPLIVNIELKVLDLVDRFTGEPVTFEIPLSARDSGERIFDLSDASFIPANSEQLRLTYVATTTASDDPVTISADQAIEVSVVVEPLVFSRVVGRLNRIVLDIPEQRQTVPGIPDGLDNVNIASTAVEVHVTSAIGFRAEVELDITGSNAAGASAPPLFIPVTLERGDPDFPVAYVLTPSASALTDFLNFLPSEIVINSRVIVGDGVTPDIIDTSHSVTLDSVVFDTEPRLAIAADTQMEPEETLQNITFRDSKARKRIRSNFVSGNVTATLENSIPLGVGVRLFVGRTREGVFDTASDDHVITIPRLRSRFPGDIADDYPKEPFQANAAPVDPTTGFSDGTKTTEIPIELTKDEVLEFILEDSDTGSLFTGVRVTLPATQGNVEIRATDFINIIAGMGVELLLDSHLLD
jgi:hypothetical protein